MQTVTNKHENSVYVYREDVSIPG